MCVILVAEKRRLSAQIIGSAIEFNPHGNGLAWIESGKVRWAKDLTEEEVVKLAATLPLPYVFHARWATKGPKGPSLCHPFPLRKEATGFETKGVETRGVLFHNGTWEGAEDALEQVAERDDIFLSGPWSDSRAMSVIAAARGLKALDLVPLSQRIAVLTPKGVQTKGWGWSYIGKGKGIYASNTRFLQPQEQQTLLVG